MSKKTQKFSAFSSALNTAQYSSRSQTNNHKPDPFSQNVTLFTLNRPLLRLPVIKFKPTNAAVKFWEQYFSRFEEISLIDYINALIPVLEAETDRKFSDDQLMKLIDTINYENSFKVNRHESQFFIDKIWNSYQKQSRIWNGRYVPVREKVKGFVDDRQAKKDQILKTTAFSSASVIGNMIKEMKLGDRLSELEVLKIPSHRRNMFVLECTRGIEP